VRLCFLDFETFWSETHTLTKMSPIEYCMHPETELQFMAIKFDHHPTDVFAGEEQMRHVLSRIDWSQTLVIGHNMSTFDSMLLKWRLGVQPAMWGCTLAMARPLHAKGPGLGLGQLVAHYAAELEAMGIKSVKDNRALIQTRGRKMKDFSAQEVQDMLVYNKDDTEQCAGIFHILKKHFTPAELWHIDCNIRMLVDPQFELDTGLLETALSTERSNKHKALLDLAKLLQPEDVDWSDETAVAERVREQMASAPKFSAVLESRGVDVPMKWSKTNPDKEIPAIAKTDEAMEELLEHDDEVVATAARARLSAKSTQLETRIQSFLSTFRTVGKLPVPAHYCGADTTGRDSGFLYNMLNLPRINPDKPKVSDALRNSIRAPKGKVVLVQDLSGIELRVNHTLWKVQRSMDGWAAKPNWDLYRDTAAHMYDCAAEEVQKHQRHYAKVLELACGYQQGPVTFRQTARTQGGLRLTMPQSEQGVSFWRGRYPEIAKKDGGGWSICHDALHHIERGSRVNIDTWGLCYTEKEAVVLPSGRRIRYPGLRQEYVEQYRVVNGERVKKRELVWLYGEGRHRAFIYGGKVDENIVQAMARDIIFPQALEFWRKTRLRPQHKVYDELVYVVDPSMAEELSEQLAEIMRTPPPYWPDLVLWSEGDIAETYGAAK
jgi:DNA polymerase family A